MDMVPTPVILGRFEGLAPFAPAERGQDPKGTVRCARVRLLPGPVFLTAAFEDQWRQVQRALPRGCEIWIVDSLRDVTDADFEELAG